MIMDDRDCRVEFVAEVQGTELARDRDGPAVTGSRPGRGSQHIDDMYVVLEIGRRRGPGGQCHDRRPQAIGPVPGSVGAVVAAPVAPVSTEDLDAGRIPVVPEQVGGSLRAVELDGGP